MTKADEPSAFVFFHGLFDRLPVAGRGELEIPSEGERTFDELVHAHARSEKRAPGRKSRYSPGRLFWNPQWSGCLPFKVATYFLIQWLGDDGQVLSKSRLFAVPKDIASTLDTQTRLGTSKQGSEKFPNLSVSRTVSSSTAKRIAAYGRYPNGLGIRRWSKCSAWISIPGGACP